ncbi:hypothetical protein PAMC26510_28125 [Caballeronia sordidicola]|uniref:Uncharacterized protein n=1 Tax=Caballeronia sordidicola TaxID=196367 RepID=A0A242MD63_CABSO|nr:hypothetical protein PAMC26510_28125 [Caballeronia sordidicola]OTP72238.1 hypothetical protein PAMC26577_21055 [Caballeronia sordidicola]
MTRIAHVSGQSCGQTARTNSAGAFMGDPFRTGEIRQMKQFYYGWRKPTVSNIDK